MSGKGGSRLPTHETVSSFRIIAQASERKFGIVLGSIFLAFGLFPLLRDGSAPHYWLVALAASLLAAAWVRPVILKPVNRAWYRFGLALSAVVNPIVMAILYFCAVVPMGLFLRYKGRDLLQLKRRPAAETYWIHREPPGPLPGTFGKQF
jgi:hypothetical protein